MNDSGQILAGTKMRPRKRCPFYGFFFQTIGKHLFIDQLGDACGLDKCQSCRLEKSGQTVDWNTCPLQKPLPEILPDVESLLFYPDELQLRENNLFQGIEYQTWLNYIMQTG